jgi:coenzyme F420-0:L-glutamate ligase/coenzyme F420-1:gamma-L-glutamate ligase
VKPGTLQLCPLRDFPAVMPGDSLGDLVVSGTRAQNIMPDASSVLIVAQKVVSKAEGRRVRLADVDVTAEARELAHLTGKDSRLVTLILSESRSIIRTRPGLIIAEHYSGHILANAGIDGSNVGVTDESDGESVLLWPENPDASARALARHLGEAFGLPVPVIISDSLGRPWRMGTVGFAIGVSGFEPIWDQVGERDLDGRVMQVTAPAIADALAASASLVQGETDQGQPVVWAQGCHLRLSEEASAQQLLRPLEQDMFR